ncbi:MAG: 3-dehydroquinate dehydratase [Bacteroidales bacterium]|nr:3-dehydroquinate dehydratase [Bacteroidales bacterium]
MKRIEIINGANLNLLERRESEYYGGKPFMDFLKELREKYPQVQIDYFQSNVEGEIVNALQESKAEAIILNAAGYTHTSVVIRDAVLLIDKPVAEVHISKIFSREEFRQKSLIAPVCKGTISGFGLQSYELALLYFLSND